MQLWKELSLAHCETLLNQALAHDLAWNDHAQPLEGARVLFVLQTLDMSVLAQFKNKWVALSFDSGNAQADLTVSATPKACLEALRDKRLPRSIKIAGDAVLAQHLQEALFDSNIDWEGVFAQRLGDIPATALKTLAQKGWEIFSQIKRDFIADTHDYLIDEAKLVITASEQQTFIDEVTALRYATDRLEARIKHLQNKGNPC